MTLDAGKKLIAKKVMGATHKTIIEDWNPDTSLDDLSEVLGKLSESEWQAYSLNLFKMWKNDIKTPEWPKFNHLPPCPMCWKALVITINHGRVYATLRSVNKTENK